ncbi:protein of unknown function DUF1747 [Penicillium griseofulvum]|uniref:Histone chaperone RTT106/FACT complex subunit SPT16-like middle domain-containing protein n=1 Tax=Penicillium patulum TaxID=5078 RepID=A0A135L8N4_PENPA|nr:protein of unknown function DUF1747 [Penicillium griseofulvum]KXG45321.1 protein of unknown function DUF1747 [Penicillium griseofulvum]
MGFAAINYSNAPIAAIEEAFATEPLLKKRVYDAIGTTPQHKPLFEDLAKYTSSLLARTANTTLPSRPVGADGPTAKKRKLQNGDSGETAQASVNLKDGNAPVQFYVQDVSFSTPQRKKLTLEITAGHKYLQARNQATKEIEFGVSMDKIRHALCLPVPEKTQKQFNFCIIPEYADGITPPPEGTAASEAMVFTVADGPAKAAFSGNGEQLGHSPGESAEGFIRKILNENMPHTNVVRPDDKQFVSAMPEAHRKGEKAYHVKAFRGSKEGYLFLLSTGILFAFKKPLLFFSFATIDSVSYTSVLQRTFNLNVMARPANGSEEDVQEFEFSMIDQDNFSGIDTYIKRHGLQDASLAEARRAKVYNVNKTGGEDAAPTTEAAGEDESELQKAQRELEDQEDEEEEDYNPDSDDSEGSGSSSEEDDDDDDDDAGQDSDEDMDLVENELGSEAEDVPNDH